MLRRFPLALTVLAGVLLAGALLLATPATAEAPPEDTVALTASVDLDQLVADPAPLSPADATEAAAPGLFRNCTQRCSQEYVDCFNGSTPLYLCEAYYCQCLQGCGSFCY